MAASILARFSDENAETRLVLEGETGEFGAGRGHLYDSLKRLAVADPDFIANNTTSELESNLERILNESDDSHRFLVTANGNGTLSPEILQRLKKLTF